jgi:hypothetical protein
MGSMSWTVRQYQAESLGSYKHSSLIGPFISYEGNEVVPRHSS